MTKAFEEKTAFLKSLCFWSFYDGVFLFAAFRLFAVLRGYCRWAAFVFLGLNLFFLFLWLLFRTFLPVNRRQANRASERIFGSHSIVVFGSYTLVHLLKPKAFLPLSACISGVLLVVVLSVLYCARRKNKIKITRLEQRTEKLPKDVEGLRIAHITDLHAGTWVGLPNLEELVRAVNEQKPDIIVVTGDVMDERLGIDCGEELSVLRKLSARLGIFAVVGSHDHKNVGKAVEFMQHSGMTVLRTQAAEVGGIIIAGADDRDHITKGRWGLTRSELLTLAYEFAQKKTFLLLLRHRPIVEDGTKGHFDFQLSGHKHGVSLLSLFFGRFPGKRGKAKQLAEGGLVYSCRGMGYAGAPFRVYCSPEILVLDLVRKS